jgi:hypothetical protein
MKFCIKCNGPVYDDHLDCTACQKKDAPPVVVVAELPKKVAAVKQAVKKKPQGRK